MAEPPPPIQQFGRYDGHAKSARSQAGLHASRIQLGEVVDLARRPPLRFQVEDDHMRLYNSMTDSVPLSVGEMVDAASGFVEMSKEPQQKQKEAPGESSRRRKAKVPERPLTCPGLHPRKHPLASHPTLGVRPPSTPSIPLPQWQPPMTNIEYTHQKPFESAFFDQPLAQPYVVGGVLPNSSGHFTERRRDGTGVYTRAHAAQSLEALRANPQRPTDWAQENLHHRHKSFHQLKVDNVPDLSDASRLFVPTTKRLTSKDADAGDVLRAEIANIAKARKQFQRANCGLTMRSRLRAQENRDAQEALRIKRETEVQEHIAQHNDKLLTYRIAFDKFDRDGSGSIDVQELGQVLRFMGLSVPGAAQTDTSTDQDGSSSSSSSSRAGFASRADSTSLRADSSELNALTALMAQYDTDKSGELSFDEFAAFARSALQDPSSKPIFLSKRALKNSVKAITRTKALGS